jgi:hypothetical protein
VKQLRGALEIHDLPRLVEQVRFGEARAQIEYVKGRRPPSSWSVVEQCLRACASEAANPQMDGGAGNTNSSGDVGGRHPIEPEQDDAAAPDNPLRGRGRANPPFKAVPIRRTRRDCDRPNSTVSQLCNIDRAGFPAKMRSLPCGGLKVSNAVQLGYSRMDPRQAQTFGKAGSAGSEPRLPRGDSSQHSNLRDSGNTSAYADPAKKP